MTTLFYADGHPVPEADAARARMGKSGTVGHIHSRGPCYRCGGAGGYQGWPGFTCYRCGGRGSMTFETYATKVYTQVGLERLQARQAKAAAKRAAKAAAAAQERAEVFAAWAPQHQDLIAALVVYEGPSEFLRDMKAHVLAVRPLSERQVEATRDALEREAQRAAEAAAAKPLPTFEGRATIEGEILTVKTQRSQFGETLKMLVKHADGWKVWGTIPTALTEAAYRTIMADRDRHYTGGYAEVLKGRRVRFTAKVERSKDDAGFGFFSRPTQATLLEA